MGKKYLAISLHVHTINIDNSLLSVFPMILEMSVKNDLMSYYIEKMEYLQKA